jgi:hypothetical protein
VWRPGETTVLRKWLVTRGEVRLSAAKKMYWQRSCAAQRCTFHTTARHWLKQGSWTNEMWPTASVLRHVWLVTRP